MVPVLALVAASAAAQPLDDLHRAEHDPTVVAVVGGQPVTFGEVRRSYGLEPVWSRGQRRDEAYRVQLDRVVADRLLALEARQQGVDEEPYAASRLAFLEDKEVVRALYRSEVLAQVDLAEADLQVAYLRSKRRVRLDVVTTPDSLRAVRYAEALRDAAATPEIDPADTRDTTDWMGFYDVGPAMQEVVFDLASGETAGPLAIGDYYHVVRLVEGVRESFTSERDFAEQRSRLERTLTEQRAQPLAARYVAEVMAGQQVRLERDAFAALGHAMQDALQPSAPTLSEAETARAMAALPLRGDEVVVTWRGGQMTAREVLWAVSHLPASPLRAGRPLAPQLKAAVGTVVRNHVLAERGRALGLDTLADVRREVAWARDQFLSDRLRDHQRHVVRVTDDDVAAFRASEAFARVDERMTADLQADDAAVRSLIRAHRLARWESDTAARLHDEYDVRLHIDRLENQLHHPNQVLTQDPAPMMVREIFQ